MSTTITIKNHSFIVNTTNRRVLSVVTEIKELISTIERKYDFKRKRHIYVTDKVFIGGNGFIGEYIFPTALIRQFVTKLKFYHIPEEDVKIIDKRKNKHEKCVLTLKDGLEDRNNQSKYINAVIDSKEDTKHLVTLEMGGGKTYIACRIMSSLNLRVAIVVLANYLDKWVSDIKHHLNIEDKDILVVTGEKILHKLITDKINGNEIPKILIFGNRTLLFFYKEYRDAVSLQMFKREIYPHNISETLDIGLLLFDEAHQEFQTLFETVLYFGNVSRILGLSGTFITKDQKLREIEEYIFPEHVRLNFDAYSKHISVKSIRYTFENIQKIKYRRPTGYSQNLMEMSILKNRVIYRNYFEMLKFYLDKEFISRRTKNQKALIFVDSIEFATQLHKDFKRHYTKLDVRRYISKDSYDNLMEGELIISNVMKAGTGVDIPNLIYIGQTINTDSPKMNLQSLYRLRKMNNAETIVNCFWTPNIDQHQKYHKNKLHLLGNRVKSIVVEDYRKRI